MVAVSGPAYRGMHDEQGRQGRARRMMLPGDGMASLSLGSGPPLLFLPGLTPDHTTPRGWARRFALHQMRPDADRRQVWWAGRRRGLAPGATMADIAGDYAVALREWGGGADRRRGRSRPAAASRSSWRRTTPSWSTASCWWRLPAGSVRAVGAASAGCWPLWSTATGAPVPS